MYSNADRNFMDRVWASREGAIPNWNFCGGIGIVPPVFTSCPMTDTKQEAQETAKPIEKPDTTLDRVREIVKDALDRSKIVSLYFHKDGDVSMDILDKDEN